MKPFPLRIIHRVETTPSTNSLANEMLIENPTDGSVVLTYHQTQGRGQKGNTWETKAGQNLTFSLICYPRFLKVADIFLLSKIACLAVRSAIEHILPQADVLVKWPNDVLLNGKKVAGILIENQLDGQHLKSCVVGIGLNVNQLQFDPQIANKATSIAQVLGDSIDLERVLALILREFDREYRLIQQHQRAKIDRAYLQYLYGYQEAIYIWIDGVKHHLPIVGIDSHGRMAISMDGKLRYFAMKEIKIELG